MRIYEDAALALSGAIGRAARIDGSTLIAAVQWAQDRAQSEQTEGVTTEQMVNGLSRFGLANAYEEGRHEGFGWSIKAWYANMTTVTALQTMANDLSKRYHQRYDDDARNYSPYMIGWIEGIRTAATEIQTGKEIR